MANFTREQLKELETLYGLKRVETEVLPVRDGVVTRDSKVWWRGESGAQHIRAGELSHWRNSREYPSAYQLKEPTRKVVYAD